MVPFRYLSGNWSSAARPASVVKALQKFSFVRDYSIAFPGRSLGCHWCRTRRTVGKEIRVAMKRKETGRATEIPQPATGDASAADRGETREQIALRAYYLAEERGFASGREVDDWLEAERQVNAAAGADRPAGTRGSNMERIEKINEVDAPLRAVYNQWTQFEEFPRFMEGVREVRQIDDTHVRWHAEVWGKDKEWDAEITEQEPDKRISWKSISGAESAGTVRFQALDADRTQVRL